MAQRGIGRSAATVGLVVLVLLIGGRMIGTWQHTGQLTHLDSAGRRAGQAHPAASTGSSPPVAAPVTSPAAPSPAPTTGAAGTAPKPKPQAHGTSHPGDPTFGAMRTTGSAAVALTFDDGPSPVWTPRMLDLLKQQGIKATFCLIGRQVQEYPALVQRIVREGHTLCNHTWAHDEKLGSKTPAQIRADLSRTSAAILAAVPTATISYYRQPGGIWTANVVNIAQQLGMTPLGWAVDPADWSKPGTQAIINRVTQHTHSGSIVLMHDGGGDRSQTFAACHTLFPWLKQRYKLVQLP